MTHPASTNLRPTCIEWNPKVPILINRGSYIIDILQKEPGSTATAHGWVKTRRDGKGVHFIQLQDGSSAHDLQVVVVTGALPDSTLLEITTGSALRVTGELVKSPGPNQPVELRADDIHVFGTADPATYPLQKKGHTMEFLRGIAHLRSRSNTLNAVFRVRNALSNAIHRFFQTNGFVYVHTPIITTSDCEGAGAMFTVTAMNGGEHPRRNDGGPDFEQDFFGKHAYLTVSGQLQAEIFASAFANVYTFGPTFRAENSNTPRHLAEFWMIEPELAFADLNDNRALAERFLREVIGDVLNGSAADLEFFNKRIDNTVLSTLENVANSKFEHVSYTDAVSILETAAANGRTWQYPCSWGADLQSEHERYLTEEVFRKPVVVTDYPKEIKPFYMRLNDDLRTVGAMDVLFPRVGEIMGGSQREERLDVLRRRLGEYGMTEESYWWYLDLRRYGSVPHSGFGLGFERLVMFVTGMKNIRDVIPCPRTPGNAAF